MSTGLKTLDNPFQSSAIQNSTVDAARVQTEVMAMLVAARQMPRDKYNAFDRIKNAFSRPRLATSGMYAYSKGGSDISGLSIRAAECIAQEWGNIQFGFRELKRGKNEKGVAFSEVEAYCWDIESNTRRQLVFIVSHWRDTKKGGYQLTDEREIYELISNQAQRRVRSCILAIIPSDVCEAAEEQIAETMKANVDLSPENVGKIAIAFEKFGVPKEAIEKFIQRNIINILPAQVVRLQQIYASIRDGVAKPSDFFDVKDERGSVQVDLEVVSAEMSAINDLMELAKYSSSWHIKLGECGAMDTIRHLHNERKIQLEAAAAAPSDYASEGGDYVA